MLLHVARDGAGSFAVLIFLHSSILAFGRGHAIKQLPRGPGITRPSQQEPVLGLFHLFYRNGSRTLRGPRASVDRVTLIFIHFKIW